MLLFFYLFVFLLYSITAAAASQGRRGDFIKIRIISSSSSGGRVYTYCRALGSERRSPTGFHVWTSDCVMRMQTFCDCETEGAYWLFWYLGGGEGLKLTDMSRLPHWADPNVENKSEIVYRTVQGQCGFLPLLSSHTHTHKLLWYLLCKPFTSGCIQDFLFCFFLRPTSVFQLKNIKSVSSFLFCQTFFKKVDISLLYSAHCFLVTYCETTCKIRLHCTHLWLMQVCDVQTKRRPLIKTLVHKLCLFTVIQLSMWNFFFFLTCSVFIADLDNWAIHWGDTVKGSRTNK